MIIMIMASQFVMIIIKTILIILMTITRAQLVMASLFLITSSLAVFSALLWAGFDPNWSLSKKFNNQQSLFEMALGPLRPQNPPSDPLRPHEILPP